MHRRSSAGTSSGLHNPLGPRLDLRALREAIGRTQEQIARAAAMDQGDVSRLEQREDAKLSTLRRYVRALGGKLELVVVLKTGHRLRVDL
jgi:predicted transcriptional regulator